MNEKLSNNSAPKSMGTSQKSLFIALNKVHECNVSDNYISTEYEVCRDTLRNINKNIMPTRGQQKYIERFVNLLNDLRLGAKNRGDMAEEHRISNALRDILLVSCGIATDAEMEEMDHKKRQKRILGELGLTTR